jgi:hypothetical protein
MFVCKHDPDAIEGIIKALKPVTDFKFLLIHCNCAGMCFIPWSCLHGSLSASFFRKKTPAYKATLISLFKH